MCIICRMREAGMSEEVEELAEGGEPEIDTSSPEALKASIEKMLGRKVTMVEVKLPNEEESDKAFGKLH